jgi:hypothetical protein
VIAVRGRICHCDTFHIFGVNGNTASLVCNGIDVTLAKRIHEILKGTRRNEAAVRDISGKLDQIINQISDRRLSPGQLQDLESSARGVCASFPEINVAASNGNQEAQRFAMDFVSGFKACGCRADLALPIPGLTPDVIGVLIGVRDTDSVDPSAQELGKILSNAGVPFSFRSMKPDFFPSEKFVLVIGAKQ